MKIIYDTLKEPCGKWSAKRLTALVAFAYALSYEGLAMFCELPSKEYVFSGLLLLVASTLGLTVWANKKIKNEN